MLVNKCNAHLKWHKFKNHMIIPVDEENAFDKFQHCFMMRKLRKRGVEKTCLNIINVIDNIPIATIILNGENIKFPLKSGNRQEYPFYPFLFNIILEISSRGICQEKSIKEKHIGKEEFKCLLFSDDMICLPHGRSKNSVKNT